MKNSLRKRALRSLESFGAEPTRGEPLNAKELLSRRRATEYAIELYLL